MDCSDLIRFVRMVKTEEELARLTRAADRRRMRHPTMIVGSVASDLPFEENTRRRD